jgi:inner membrane transporter RhtA
VFATMNLSLYTAIDRIGLGLAVTLEFLGPIGTVVLGETLAPIDWLAIGLIVTANAASIVVTPATAPRLTAPLPEQS